jgi:hypothetical protein
MLRISTVNHVSDFIKTRASSMWVRKLKSANPNVIRYNVRGYRIKENRGKHPRIISVNLVEDTAECVSRWTGEECEANSYGNLCCHVYRALEAIATANERRRAA